MSSRKAFFGDQIWARALPRKVRAPERKGTAAQGKPSLVAHYGSISNHSDRFSESPNRISFGIAKKLKFEDFRVVTLCVSDHMRPDLGPKLRTLSHVKKIR